MRPSRETIASIRELVLSKAGSAEEAVRFMQTAQPALRGHRPDEIVSRGDLHDLMTLTALVTSMTRRPDAP